jgi:hypothetical protein
VTPTQSLDTGPPTPNGHRRQNRRAIGTVLVPPATPHNAIARRGRITALGAARDCRIYRSSVAAPQGAQPVGIVRPPSCPESRIWASGWRVASPRAIHTDRRIRRCRRRRGRRARRGLVLTQRGCMGPVRVNAVGPGEDVIPRWSMSSLRSLIVGSFATTAGLLDSRRADGFRRGAGPGFAGRLGDLSHFAAVAAGGHPSMSVGHLEVSPAAFPGAVCRSRATNGRRRRRSHGKPSGVCAGSTKLAMARTTWQRFPVVTSPSTSATDRLERPRIA